MTRNTRSLSAPPNDRLKQDVEFLRFLSERCADAQRDADRCQSEIDTRMAEVDSFRREQAEHLNIVEACEAGLGVNDRANRPAPVLTDRVEGGEQ